MVSIRLELDEMRGIAERIQREMGPGAVHQALGAAIGRTKQFAVDTVAERVSALYNIAEADVRSANTRGNTVDVSIRVGGDDTSVASIHFLGRTLTLGHFDFSPHSPPRGKYTVMGTVYRGTTKPLGGNRVFVPRGGIAQIPFRRHGARTDIEAIHTVSVPQMILNERLEDPIREAIGERLMEEFANQFERARNNADH